MNTLSITLLLGLFFVVDLKPLNDITKWGHDIVKRSDINGSSGGNSSLLCGGSNCNNTLNATSLLNVTVVQLNFTELCQHNLTLRCNGSLVNLKIHCNNITIEKSLLHCVSETSNVTLHNANVTTVLAVNSSTSVNSTANKITSTNNTANSTVENNTVTTVVPSTSKVENNSTVLESRANQTNVPSTSSAFTTSPVSTGTQQPTTTTVAPTTTQSTNTKSTATQSTTTRSTTAQSTMAQTTKTTSKPTTQSTAPKTTMITTHTTKATATLTITTPVSSKPTVKSTEKPSTKETTTTKTPDVHTKKETTTSVEASTYKTTSEYPHPISTMESPYNSEKNIKFFYVNVLIPVGIGVCGALLIAFSVVLFKCCRRNKVKKVRYFGKPRGYTRNNMDHMNLLANSSDEE